MDLTDFEKSNLLDNEHFSSENEHKNILITDSNERNDSSCLNKKLWKKDGKSIGILMFLYVLQGIPLGIASAMPLILLNKGITYEQQALFSLTSFPFSIKLLWAPLVDSIFFKRFGRRKSWLLPAQYFIGLTLFWLSYNIDDLTDFENSGSIFKLTVIFFLLTFGAATQDIAVDGWCLTMLSSENIGWASTCNSTGQNAGYFIGNVIFLALESVDFSNKYFRPIFGIAEKDFGIVTLSSFMYFWGIIFIVATTLVGCLKTEKKSFDDDFTLKQTYLILLAILKKKLMILYIFLSLTCRLGLSPIDTISGLKMVENGMPKENLAMMAVPMVPIQILLPLLISKYTAGPRPLNIWIKAYLPRVFIGLIIAVLVYYTKIIGTKSPEREIGLDFPIYWYLVLLFIYAIHAIITNCHFVAIMAFHAKVSDPNIGGTSMTLMNTVSNLGSSWCSTVSLFFVDKLSTFGCELPEGNMVDMNSNNMNLTNDELLVYKDYLINNENPNYWNDKSMKDKCINLNGTFNTIKDGYYIEVLISTIIGYFWLVSFKKCYYFLDRQPVRQYHYNASKKNVFNFSLKNINSYMRLENLIDEEESSLED